jgi:MFS superfamily sulfate permease-like transporter
MTRAADLLPRRADWTHVRPGRDLTAGLMVGLVALPLAHDFLLELADVTRVRVVVLRMSRVTAIDATGAHVLADTVSRLEGRGITVLLSGVRAHHERVLRELGVYDRLAHEHHLFSTTPEAIEHARVHAARLAHVPTEDTEL